MHTDAHGLKTKYLSVFICVNPWLKSDFSASCYGVNSVSMVTVAWI